MHIRTLELILHQTSILFLGLTPIKTLAITPMVPLGPCQPNFVRGLLDCKFDDLLHHIGSYLSWM